MEKGTTLYPKFVQGVPDQNFQIQTGFTQRLWKLDPKLVKPKCV